MFHPRFKPPCRDRRYTGCGPSHAYDTKFASWLVSQQFAATTLRRLRGSPWKRRAVSCEKAQAPSKRPVLCVQMVTYSHTHKKHIMIETIIIVITNNNSYYYINIYKYKYIYICRNIYYRAQLSKMAGSQRNLPSEVSGSS
jgi:hypothetical protein